MNIYQTLLEWINAKGKTESNVLTIVQLDYQNGKYNDFNAPSKVYSLEDYKAVADREFTVQDALAWQYTPELDPLVKVYVGFDDGSGMAYEILNDGEKSLIAGVSSIPDYGFVN